MSDNSFCPSCWSKMEAEAQLCPVCYSAKPSHGWLRKTFEGRQIRNGQYRVIGPLGAGGFGATVRAMQFLNGNPLGTVAIKFPLCSTDGPSPERFYEEAAALRSVNHPNIVTLHDAFVEDETPFLVMQYVEGRTLGDAMAHGAFTTFGSVLQIILQVGHAINELHSKGVIHCDLKPSNIILVPWIDGSLYEFAKVIDFGIASRWRIGEGWRSSGGTVGFAAPEQMAGAPSPRSDLFSLAVLFFWMLTGSLPYSPELCLNPYQWRRTGPPRLPSPVPPEMAELLRHCLQPVEENRFAGVPGFLEQCRALRTAVRETVDSPQAAQQDQASLLKLAKETFLSAGLAYSDSGKQAQLYRRAYELFQQAKSIGPIPSGLANMLERASKYAGR